MSYILIFLFFLSIIGIIHSYVLFPASLRLIDYYNNKLYYSFTKHAKEQYNGSVSVIMSCYNEEAVLPEKIKCLKEQSFLREKTQYYIGSDASTDSSNAILAEWAENDDRVHFFPFESRRGKAPVINDLAVKAKAAHGAGDKHILLFTDANVLLSPDCIHSLARHFNDTRIGVVDSHMVSTGTRLAGISNSEKAYIKREVSIKHLEGKLFGTMMGTFGGCYAIRSDVFAMVPDNFVVDDFYITVEAMLKGYGAISDLEAICEEAVSHDINEEYKRKKRISSGNFQNLNHFFRRALAAPGAFQYCFFSHKVLRWLSPLLLFIAWAISGVLWMWGETLFGWFFVLVLTGGILVVGLDWLFEKWKLHWRFIRHIRYFIWMNIAVLEGLNDYLQGKESNVWQPPKRHY
jgi:cellulose synthase/poly-beta-1,6-N-acetylglucosamine synthase-like glycosyltransferase